MNTIEQLEQLAKDAKIILSETGNSPDVLPFTSKAILIIEANPGLQTEFEQAFLHMDKGDYAPAEFIEVCMHIFHWPNVKYEFEARHRSAIESNDWRAEPVYRHYLEAFEPDWEDAMDIYESYFRVGKSRSKKAD